MRILIAPDKFKGSLSAREAADHIAVGLRDRLPNAIIRTLPMADGGEGTAEVICDARGGELVNCAAHDALGRAIEASYVWLPDHVTAVMEMSAAAGKWGGGPGKNGLFWGKKGRGGGKNDPAPGGGTEGTFSRLRGRRADPGR